MLTPETSLALLLAGLVTRFAALISLQAYHRMCPPRRFRWPEDAVEWEGSTDDEDPTGPVARAQAALRNDAESMPLFLATSLLWIDLSPSPTAVAAVHAAYLVARSLHAYWLVHPRQPHRNRAFAVSQLCLLAAVADTLRLTW